MAGERIYLGSIIVIKINPALSVAIEGWDGMAAGRGEVLIVLHVFLPESSGIQSILVIPGNGFLAVLPAKIEISILVESRLEFMFHQNSNRNDETGMTSRIDQNGIW
jgi:hypothetical protein